jgi:hypothetical protein
MSPAARHLPLRKVARNSGKNYASWRVRAGKSFQSGKNYITSFRPLSAKLCKRLQHGLSKHPIFSGLHIPSAVSPVWHARCNT